MEKKQRPIGSGFTAASTADEVLKGIDLTGKNAIITGGHSGIGLEMTRSMSKAGAFITVAVRDPQQAEDKVAGVDNVELSQLDLINPTSIVAFVERYLKKGRPLHILLNNAGVMGGPLVYDKRGYESHFAINHLGHFQLTLGLLPALQEARGARIVNTTSGAFRVTDIRWDDVHFRSGGYNPHFGYGQSKTANVLFAVELDKRWAQYDIRAYAAHPGVIVRTNLGPARPVGEVPKSMFSKEELMEMGLVDEEGNPIINPEAGTKTAQQGASTIVFAATNPLLADIGGVCLKDNDISPLDRVTPIRPGLITDVVPHAIDPNSAKRLWELSESLLD